jgi:hypothetical protein
MDSKIIWDLKDSLSQYNTHIIDGEVCYGGCVEDNPIGIGFYRDFKRIKWVIPFNYENVIEGICVKKMMMEQLIMSLLLMMTQDLSI